MGTTATGLRYPEPVDPVANGAAAMKNLADDVTAKYGRGRVALNVQGIQTDLPGGIGTILSTPFTLPAARTVLSTVFLTATQLNAAGGSVSIAIYMDGVQVLRLFGGSTVAGNAVYVPGYFPQSLAAGAHTVDLRCSQTGGGALRVAPATTFMLVEDIGV